VTGILSANLAQGMRKSYQNISELLKRYFKTTQASPNLTLQWERIRSQLQDWVVLEEQFQFNLEVETKVRLYHTNQKQLSLNETISQECFSPCA
jgi:virulence-associated protein VapD